MEDIHPLKGQVHSCETTRGKLRVQCAVVQRSSFQDGGKAQFLKFCQEQRWALEFKHWWSIIVTAIQIPKHPFRAEEILERGGRLYFPSSNHRRADKDSFLNQC